MSSYHRVKERLNNFFSKYVDNFTIKNNNYKIDNITKICATSILYQHTDLIINNDIEIYVVCQKSFGCGDIINGIKTYNILNRYFKNVSILVKNEDDKESINKLCGKNNTFKIYTFDGIDKISKHHNLKIFISCALPIYSDRFKNIIGRKNFLFIDEYNGWRIYLDPRNAQEPSTDNKNDDISEEKSESDSDECIKYNHSPLVCKICLEKEHYQRFYASDQICNNQKIKYIKNNGNIDDNSYLASSGLGKIKNSMPALGVHIVKEEIGPIENTIINTFLDKTNRYYYFAYFSIIENQPDTINYLQLYINAMYMYNEEKTMRDYTNFVVLDPQKYLYKATSLFFTEGYTIKILNDAFIVKNNIKKIRMLYLTQVPHNEMISLIKDSQPFIFLSGDQSMVEGISLQLHGITKVIFYQLQSWKKKFIEEFRNISTKVLPPHSILIGFQKLIFCDNEKYLLYFLREVVNILKYHDENIIKQSAIVNKYIIKQYNIEDTIVSLVCRIIFQDNYLVGLTNLMIEKFLSEQDFRQEYYIFISYINDRAQSKEKRKITNEGNPATKKIKLINNTIYEI